ncbi:NAD(P)-dependent oxidoreductase [Candidatus Peregrinibacteria bacterium]|nr:NAD(P)-dependent oxidoreductase [Candidatus Peregrinibacteria bacterium]
MYIKKILVTGSSGTIGTRLCEILLQKGYTVIGTDIKPNKWYKGVDAITTIVDLMNKSETLNNLPGDIDMVIHLAAIARAVDLSKNQSIANNNVLTTSNILEYAKLNNINKFIFASSREVYGGFNKSIESENELSTTSRDNPYASSKIDGELLVKDFQKNCGIDYVILRFSNTYGMYDTTDRLIPRFIELCKECKDLPVFGQDKILDFTYIDDIINGIILSIEKFDSVKNDTFNLSSGKGCSIFHVAEIIKSNFNSDNQIVIEENKRGDVLKFVADITKAKENLGYTPQTSIENGIKKAIEWYKKI